MIFFLFFLPLSIFEDLTLTRRSLSPPTCSVGSRPLSPPVPYLFTGAEDTQTRWGWGWGEKGDCSTIYFRKEKKKEWKKKKDCRDVRTGARRVSDRWKIFKKNFRRKEKKIYKELISEDLKKKMSWFYYEEEKNKKISLKCLRICGGGREGRGEEEGYFCTVLFFFIAKGRKTSLKFLTLVFSRRPTHVYFLFSCWMDDESILCLALTFFLFFKCVFILSFWVKTGMRGSTGE